MRHRALSRLLSLIGLVILIMTTAACSLSGAPAEVTPTYEGPPRVTLASPQPNATYLVGTSVNILARVENAGPDLQRVELKVNELIIGDQDVSAQAGGPTLSVSTSYPASEAGSFVISVVAYRTDGTASDPATVAISVRPATVDEEPTAVEMVETEDVAPAETEETTVVEPEQAQPTPQPTVATVQQQAQPTNTPAATSTPAPTNTPNTPRITISVGANIRSGPGTVFNPPIGSLAAGAQTDLLARTPNSDWYKIRYYNGEGWISASLGEVTGNVASLPVEVGPPTPVPASPTPVPSATPVPAQVDLSIVDWSTSPFPLVCAQSIPTTITVANTGTDTSAATQVILEDLYGGSVTTSATADIGALAPNQSQTVTIPLTVTTNFAEGHLLRARVDPNNTVSETNESNNARQVEYVLSQGSCG